MIYAYIRVSTDKQTTQNQRFGINEWCLKRGLKIDNFVDETASGKIAIDHRNLGKLFNRLSCGDTLIVTELSRLGRSMLDVVEKINWCLKNGIKMYSIKENFELEDSIVSKTLIFAFTISAEIERQMISNRTKEALYRKKFEGIKLGRPIGSKNKIEANPCYPAFKQILKWDRQGISHSKIAQRIGVHRDTLRRFFIKNNLEHLLRGKRYKNI
ncbi:invertase [Campylobacter fetus subsp. testudinum]|uniref:recombinase family protein n=1 Tax=Campylobacter fetus TaxID=196 RepID=UPI000818B645|nr:recombinase family protein [Campylobacter fetus]OCR87746.1 invertase [Campylobacter fetus subsp. testudinum]OCR98916.1 invertase [Campylobacter fetus subsp. testudinum]